MKKFLFLMLMSLATPAWADDTLPPECRMLPEHKAQAGVAYQPGVDVNGKAVVPADINAAPIAVPEKIVMPLTIQMAQLLQNNNVQGLNLESTLGFIEIEQNGRVIYDGQDITSQVYVLCDKKHENASPATDGQTPLDAVEYAPENVKESHEQPGPEKQ